MRELTCRSLPTSPSLPMPFALAPTRAPHAPPRARAAFLWQTQTRCVLHAASLIPSTRAPRPIPIIRAAGKRDSHALPLPFFSLAPSPSPLAPRRHIFSQHTPHVAQTFVAAAALSGRQTIASPAPHPVNTSPSLAPTHARRSFRRPFPVSTERPHLFCFLLLPRQLARTGKEC